MSILTSAPATVSVTSFPYSLPPSGQALAIGATLLKMSDRRRTRRLSGSIHCSASTVAALS